MSMVSDARSARAPFMVTPAGISLPDTEIESGTIRGSRVVLDRRSLVLLALLVGLGLLGTLGGLYLLWASQSSPGRGVAAIVIGIVFLVQAVTYKRRYRLVLGTVNGEVFLLATDDRQFADDVDQLVGMLLTEPASIVPCEVDPLRRDIRWLEQEA